MKSPRLSHANSINTAHSSNKSLLSQEMQDLLYFKNDILKDFPIMDEKLNLKLAEQDLIISEQQNSYEKKLEKLSNHINLVNSLIINNTDLTEKVNDFQIYKKKTEEQINKLNSKINVIEKETTSYINNIEKIINDNLRYPGIIGNNARFIDFRHFIDYIIKNFREFNEFKKEIKNFDFEAFKKQINSDIQDFRFTISDNKKNSLRLLLNNCKEFDLKIEDLIKQNKQMMKENEEKFDNLKNRINDCLSEYQTKFKDLEANLNDKHIEQMKEIENFKMLRNQFVQDINSIKSNLEINQNNKELNENDEDKEAINKNLISQKNKIEKEECKNDDNDNDNDNQISKKLLFNKEKKSQFFMNTKNINYKLNDNIKRGKDCIFKSLLLNDSNNDKLDSFISKNINFIDIYQTSEEKNYLSSRKKNLTQSLEKSNSFEKNQNIKKLKNLYINDEESDIYKSNLNINFSIINEEIPENKERLKLPKSEVKKKSENNESS